MNLKKKLLIKSHTREDKLKFNYDQHYFGDDKATFIPG